MFKEQSRGQCEWIEGREDERERKIKLFTFGRKELEVRKFWADCFSLSGIQSFDFLNHEYVSILYN